MILALINGFQLFGLFSKVGGHGTPFRWIRMDVNGVFHYERMSNHVTFSQCVIPSTFN